MRFPFVSVGTHDAVVEGLKTRLDDRNDEIADLKEQLAEGGQRERLLVEKLLATREVPPIPPKRDASPVDTAIAFKAGGDRRLRSYLTTFARQERGAGKTDAAIAQRILDGDPVSDDEGVEGLA